MLTDRNTEEPKMEETPRRQSITRIVITGGPCAGKTTAMSWIQNAFTRKGYQVIFVDETATQLSNGGAPWKLTRNNREYQYRVTQLMLAKEEVLRPSRRPSKPTRSWWSVTAEPWTTGPICPRRNSAMYWTN